MTTVELKKIEKIATESAAFARRALSKSNELEAYLSMLEYRAGKVRKYPSVDALFKKLKLR
ncbi:MAG: hypothetical protein A3D64_02540 [Candidatus Wildermuthbacteria bacterium RIFCSPHIGHO2_02_FULL_49_9]|uniref:Uncharacterized protein n=3 Tax=Parcubacteria group TaxID=1794811 RepID=A0A1F8DQN7_9BACT|nr:MAG: hypothetical protein A2755_03080 [Candidatus Wolfebacteria bacterium RIFCSPHIGHO2_01_FULL_48_22]OGM92574.1 MAG: hypothetical protein A2935_01455 [Candidatus Wolfebacteria bacterium RIFCSPLOWO2_01_FULL_47_17b]OHA70127.1 MAG: hypothetical protein A3D64_02540 [Candidatus Wildermuthbacteria bacterium RIFCSPHIGHO2_02_FULL_49_9]